jgi:hypothetical protein
LKGVQKKIKCFLNGSRGETVRERAGRQEGGEREPKGRGEQGEGGKAGSNETPI